MDILKKYPKETISDLNKVFSLLPLFAPLYIRNVMLGREED